MVPKSEQEEQVGNILLQHGVTHLTHAVFPVRNRMYVVDFFIPAQRVILECWRSTSRRGVALVWVEKNACYVDMKFRRIKEANPDVKCVALVEVMQAEPELVKGYVGAVMEHADFLACSMEELAAVMRELCGVKG
ncbi:MAG: hypothetical protein LYZ66_06620 [Nitrososphaerales archaeon]|nr:hypothetical protein [Nitrososphaerales archaeon]